MRDTLSIFNIYLQFCYNFRPIENKKAKQIVNSVIIIIINNSPVISV